jgi:hypothetical protein
MAAANGRLPDSALVVIPGGRMEKAAGASWLRLREKIGKETGVWICPTSTRTAYRPYADQVFFWNEYKRGRGNLAAYPGTSNHGWGVAVDVPQSRMAELINKYGASYGWQKRWSDAPSEWWHFKYAPQNDRHKGEAVKPKPKHPSAYLSDTEKKARGKLRHARRKARVHGWTPFWKGEAREARDVIIKQMRQIRANAKGEKDGWNKHHRRERYAYLRELLQGRKKKK